MATHKCSRLSLRTAYALALILIVALTAVLVLATPASAANSPQEIALLDLVNDYRQSLGLTPLMMSDRLSDAAEKHSSDMGKYGFFSHYTSGSDWFAAGASPWDRMATTGYGYNAYKGENIAAGQTTAQAVFTAWRNSADHDKIMRQPEFQVAGVSLVEVPGSRYTYYWTLDLGSYVDPTAKWVGKFAPVGGFCDVRADAPYANAVALLCRCGAAKGFGDGTFRPNDPVTRQQFAKMVVLALGYPVVNVQACGFNDVAPNLDSGDVLYPAGYVAACYSAGITEGDGKGNFLPSKQISRAQLVTMVARAVNVRDCSVGYRTPFPEFDNGTHYRWAQRAYAAGLLRGLPGVESKAYDFWKSATRGEVCILLANAMNR